jgi:hypothetical protein
MVASFSLPALCSFERHDFLSQLPGEPRDLCIAELERGPHLLQRGMLLLKLASRLLSSRALALESGLSLLESDSPLLELALCLLARAPLLANLLIHRDERRDLLLQVGT